MEGFRATPEVIRWTGKIRSHKGTMGNYPRGVMRQGKPKANYFRVPYLKAQPFTDSEPHQWKPLQISNYE